MDSNTYDAIIVGAGGNGMCVGAYLARSGLKVGIFEKRNEEGGGFWSWENTPGFRFNHAHCNEFNEWMPFIRDFNLRDLGWRDVYPEVQNGIVWKDGRPPITLWRAEEGNGYYERSHKSIAQYSKSDADTWVHCRKLARESEQFFTNWFYNPPVMPTEDNANPFTSFGETVMELFGIPKQYTYGSARDVIDYLFESPEMRTMFYKLCEEFGSPLRPHGLGMAAMIGCFYIVQNHRVTVGGTHTMAHAMAMAAAREGVEIHERAGCREILVKNGVANGIVTEDGRTFYANKMVISNADVKQTLLGLMGGEKNLSPRWVKQAKHFKYGNGMCIDMPLMALHEKPIYKSSKWDENINKAFIVYHGAESPAEMLQHSLECEMGLEPSVTGLMPCFSSIPSQHATGYAPPGKHSWYGGWFAPNASSYSEEEWRDISANMVERFINGNYKHYAPNMTMDNIIGSHVITPWLLEKENYMPEGDFCNGSIRADQMAHNRPFPEAARYKTEVENVYLCSAGSHPHGGISTGAGYCCYKQLAEDFNLSYRPWEGLDRGY